MISLGGRSFTSGSSEEDIKSILIGVHGTTANDYRILALGRLQDAMRKLPRLGNSDGSSVDTTKYVIADPTSIVMFPLPMEESYDSDEQRTLREAYYNQERNQSYRSEEFY